MTLRIAVITPYYKEPDEYLKKCHESVLEQKKLLGKEGAVDHFFVADGFANLCINKWQAQHIILPISNEDYGNTPRAIGGIVADSLGYDFVAFLDADNWYYSNHLSSLLELWKTKQSDICCSWRDFYRNDESVFHNVSEKDEDEFSHVDTNCYLIHRKAFSCINVWQLMPKDLSALGDRVFFKWLKQNRYSISHSQNKTVAYRTLWEIHYLIAGELPPANAKNGNKLEQSYEYILSMKGISETVDRLGFWPLSQ